MSELYRGFIIRDPTPRHHKYTSSIIVVHTKVLHRVPYDLHAGDPRNPPRTGRRRDEAILLARQWVDDYCLKGSDIWVAAVDKYLESMGVRVGDLGQLQEVRRYRSGDRWQVKLPGLQPMWFKDGEVSLKPV